MKITTDLRTRLLFRLYIYIYIYIRDVLNICFVFASVPNSGRNTVFVFGRIVSSERIRIVSLYSAELETSMADFTQSVPDALARTAYFGRR